jgi:putative MFS transporter
MRGRAFALNQVITYLAVPTVALAAWLLVPQTPFGVDGWRWVIAIGALGSLVVWVLRRGLPESPRWLASIGALDRAQAIVSQMEQKVMQETGKPLPAPSTAVAAPIADGRGRFRELWSKKYAPRTVMLVIFHLAQAIGLYGFSNWVPTFLIKQGASVSSSLAHGLVIACLTPLGPLLAMTFADRVERKWQIVVAALIVCAAGLGFAEVRNSASIILCGGLVTLGATIISLNFHAYQSELFPTRIRALAVGFVYSASRISGMFSGFLIAFALAQQGVSAALALIAGCMAVVAVAIGTLGPKTRGRSLEDIND